MASSSAAYRFTYKAIAAAIARSGVVIGRTGGYPRVELHSFVEGERMDKGGAVRTIACVMESMSATSLEACVTLNEGNLAALEGLNAADTDFRVIGWRPTQLQDLTEATDSKAVLYRQLQSLEIFIQKL